MITMYSTAWCPDCKATKMALERLGLNYIEIDIDQHPEGERLVLEANGGRRSVPTLVYAGQAVSMSRFSLAKLQGWLERVGLLATEPNPHGRCSHAD
jgi:mycoredoxin